MLTLNELRKLGKVYVDHLRFFARRTHVNCIVNGKHQFGKPITLLTSPLPISQREDDEEIYPRGGVTQIELKLPNGTIVTQSECNFVDNYNKKEGVRICLERMEEQLKQCGVI